MPIITEITNNNGVPLIDITHIGSEARYNSYLGARYKKYNGSTGYVIDSGVAGHPGDIGFISMADIIINYLKTH